MFGALEQARSTLSAMHAQMLVADEWIHADETPSPVIKYINKGFPPDHQWIIDSYAWTVLNRLVNQSYTGEAPQITYELSARYKDSHEKTWEETQRKHTVWGQGIAFHIAHQMENPFLDAHYQQLGPGLGGLTFQRDYDGYGSPPERERNTPEQQEAWENFEQQRRTSLPWRVESLHPTWIFFDTGNPVPQWYIIEKPVSLRAMAARYPKLGLNPQEQSDSTDALYVEFCSDRWYGCWVNGEAITPHENADEDGIAPNGLGHTWVELAWSGLGKLDSRGSWHRRGVGMVQRGIANFKSLTFSDNWLNLIERSMIPKIIASNQDGPEEAARETEDFDPLEGAVAALGKTQIRWLESPNVPAAVIANIQARKQAIAQQFGPDVLSGEYKSEPASKFASRLEQARAPVRTPKKNLEQAIANILSWMLWDVKHEPDLQDGVGVSYSLKKGGAQLYADLKPDDAVLDGKWQVDISPLTPEEKAFKVEDAAQKEQNRWWSKQRAMKEGGEIDDIGEEMAAMKADEVWASDQTTVFFATVATQRWTEKLTGLGLMPPPPPMMGPDGQPAMGEPGQGGPALPPDVPVQPGPPLGGQQEAMERMQTMFSAPPAMNGRGGQY